MAESVPASVLDDASRRFHSPENISLGCLQVRGMFWPLSCDHFVRDYFELRHHLTRSSSVPRAMNEVWNLGPQAPSGGWRAIRVDMPAA